MTLMRTMLLLLLLAVLTSLVLGDDPGSHPDKGSRSVESTLMKAVGDVVRAVHDAENKKRGTGEKEMREIEWDEEDVLDGDWGNGGWGNGDVATGYFGNTGDTQDRLETDLFQGNTEIWFPEIGDEESDDSDNSEWWGV